MEQRKTKLVEEENTIYEIDLDCVRKKQQNAMQNLRMEERNRKNCGQKKKR